MEDLTQLHIKQLTQLLIQLHTKLPIPLRIKLHIQLHIQHIPATNHHTHTTHSTMVQSQLSVISKYQFQINSTRDS